MKNFLLKLFIFAEFIIVFGLGYAVLHMALSPMQSIILVFAMVFFLFQALGNVDKLNGYGQYNKNHQDDNQKNSDDDETLSENNIHDNEYDEEKNNNQINHNDDDDDFFLMDDNE